MRIVRASTAAAAAVIAGLWAYSYMFSRFAAYDDEGYVMMTVRQFLEGRPLYDEVFSQYGPFYYVARGAVLTLFHAPVSHDVTRLFTLVTWLLVASLLGVLTARAARTPIAGLFVLLVLVPHLRPLANEPGHPQELGLFILAALATASAWFNSPSRLTALGLVSGALIGALTLTKINLGVYAATSLLLASATFVPRRHRTGVLMTIVVAAAALPWVVMREHVLLWASGYAALTSIGILSVGLAALAGPALTVRGPSALVKVIAAAVLTATGTCAVIVGMGTSWSGLLRGVVLQPLAFATTFTIPLRVGRPAVLTAMFSLALALIYTWMTRTEEPLRRDRARFFQWLKLAGAIFGIYIATCVPEALLSVGVPLLWLVLIQPARPWQFEEWLPRIALVSLAALQTLQAYPVAGSQLAWTTFLMIPSMAICLVDGVRSLIPADITRRRTSSLLEAAAMVCMVLAYAIVLDPIAQSQRYGRLSALAFPGTVRLRLPPDEAARYHWLVSSIRERCTSLLTLPGLNSLYFWSSLDPPTALNTTAWPLLLGRDEQQRIVDAVKTEPAVCAVEYPAAIRTNGRAHEVMNQPLVRFIRDEFDTISQRPGFIFKVRRQTSTTQRP